MKIEELELALELSKFPECIFREGTRTYYDWHEERRVITKVLEDAKETLRDISVLSRAFTELKSVLEEDLPEYLDGCDSGLELEALMEDAAAIKIKYKNLM